MKRIIFFMIVCCLGTCSNYLLAQESKYQALYLFNFTKYLNWDGDEIVIGIMGNSQVLIELESIAKQNPNISLVKISGPEAVQTCNLIYLPVAQTRNFDLIQKNIGTSPIVLVVEDQDLISKGAEFAFFKEAGRLKFTLSKSALDASGVQVSSTLLGLGKVVN